MRNRIFTLNSKKFFILKASSSLILASYKNLTSYYLNMDIKAYSKAQNESKIQEYKISIDQATEILHENTSNLNPSILTPYQLSAL